MDYHADRFEDHSLIVFHQDKWIACIPAHNDQQVLSSHRGLTYGGIILIDKEVIDQLDNILLLATDYLKSRDFSVFLIKLQPAIYCSYHEKLIDSLHRHGFVETDQKINMHHDLINGDPPSPKKTSGYRNGKFKGLNFEWNESLELFYNDILVPSLLNRHQARPVHSLDELKLLQEKFPRKIRLAVVKDQDKILAAVLFFLKHDIAKSHYAASTSSGMKRRAMDYLYLEATKQFRNQNYRRLDYGTVNNPDGSINEGLMRFKHELGAQPQPQLTYRLDVH